MSPPICCWPTKSCGCARAIFSRLDYSLLKRYLKVGLPVIISNGLWGIGTAVQTAILGHMGDDAIAANSVAAVVFQILTVVVYGAANASSIIIGKTIGQGAEKLVRLYAKTLQVLYLLLGVATGLCLFLVRDWVLGFYVISPESKQLASEFMMVLSITCIGTAYQMSALTGIVRRRRHQICAVQRHDLRMAGRHSALLAVCLCLGPSAHGRLYFPQMRPGPQMLRRRRQSEPLPLDSPPDGLSLPGRIVDEAHCLC